MVLMMAGSELDPGFRLPGARDRTHARDLGQMDATGHVAKCVRKAQLEQRENARPWTAVKGPFGAAVATLARMQWTILVVHARWPHR